MTLNLCKENRIYKRLFDLKQPQRDGLLLQVHHTTLLSQKVRFVHACFDGTGQLLALVDNEANIFVVNFNTNKFWSIPKATTSCSTIRFSNFKEGEILVGTHGGPVLVLDVETGLVAGKLVGHEYPVGMISYSGESMCLTASKCEAVIWLMPTHTKVHVLHLDHCCTLKHVCFIPVTSNILALYNDDFIQIWQFETFKIKTEIPALVWYNHEVRSVAFTMDGKAMILGCRPNYLCLFLLTNFKLLKFITLPDDLHTIKQVDFIPQIGDGGANKIMAILDGRGSIHFYNITLNIIISEMVASDEISMFESCRKGYFFACVLRSGDVNVYDVSRYTVAPMKLKAVRVPIFDKKEKLKKCLGKVTLIRQQMRSYLEIEKLRMILKECGEYPDAYRITIWEHLLELPNNKAQYNAIINHKMIISFEDLVKEYPLENMRCLKNLKRLLDNLVTWAPFFLNVDYLPLFVFPFVRVFHNKPVSCFEAVATVILNWCQFWFEYFPLPPINILSMVENVLMGHDPELLDYFTKNRICTKLYAWPILRTAFSEVLTAPAWKKFWDHVLTNEPAFFVCGVVAYNVLQRGAILKLNKRHHFECFYNTHHPVDVRKLVDKTYHILKETSESIHPRQYLSMFERLKPGEYPNFCNYPKAVVDCKTVQSTDLVEEKKRLQSEEMDLIRTRLTSLDKLDELEIEDEEHVRILEMERAVREQLSSEQEHIHNHYERLQFLRQKFREEDKLLESFENKFIRTRVAKKREKQLSNFLQDAVYSRRNKSYSLTKREDKLLQHFSELLKNKYKIEALLDCEDNLTTSSIHIPSVVEKHQKELAEGIDLARKCDDSSVNLEMLNLSTGLAAVDRMIDKIEHEIEREKKGHVNDLTAGQTVTELKLETQELIAGVNKLLWTLVNTRSANLYEANSSC